MEILTTHLATHTKGMHMYGVQTSYILHLQGLPFILASYMDQDVEHISHSYIGIPTQNHIYLARN